VTLEERTAQRGRLGGDAPDRAPPEPRERAPSPAQGVGRARREHRRVERLRADVRGLPDLGIEHARDDHEVTLPYRREQERELLGVLLADVTQKDHEAPSRARGLEAANGLGEIARRVGGLEVVDAVEERAERTAPPGGRDRPVDTGERDEPHGVAASRGGVSEDQERLEQPLEVRLLTVSGAHAEAAVEHEDHALVLLLAVLAADEASVTRDGFPVDLTEGVAFA